MIIIRSKFEHMKIRLVKYFIKIILIVISKLCLTLIKIFYN